VTTIPFLSWGDGFIDDDDGWKDIFIASGHGYPEVDRHDWGTSFAVKRSSDYCLMGTFPPLVSFFCIMRESSVLVAWPQLSAGESFGEALACSSPFFVVITVPFFRKGFSRSRSSALSLSFCPPPRERKQILWRNRARRR
jgi:hypothetical protein